MVRENVGNRYLVWISFLLVLFMENPIFVGDLMMVAINDGRLTFAAAVVLFWIWKSITITPLLIYCVSYCVANKSRRLLLFGDGLVTCTFVLHAVNIALAVSCTYALLRGEGPRMH
jgi:hypothetical protein